MVGLGGQSGCERRIEVFVKIQKKNLGGRGGEGGGGGGGVRVDMNEELKFLSKLKKKKFGGGVGGGSGGGSGGQWEGSGWGGGSGWM